MFKKPEVLHISPGENAATMYDIVGDPGLSVISRKILSYLDFEALKVASEVSKSWHDFLSAKKSLWMPYFQFFLNECKDLRNEDWQALFKTFQEKATFQQILELIDMIQCGTQSDWYSWYLCKAKHPIVAICEFGTFKLFKAYLELSKLDVNRRFKTSAIAVDDTMLHVAAYYDQFDIVKYILPKVEEKNPFNGKQVTPLEWSVANGNLEMTRLFCQYVPSHQSRQIWKQLLTHAAIQGGKNNVEMILEFIQPHLEENSFDDFDRHPLETAIALGSKLELFKMVYCHAKTKADLQALYTYAKEYNRFEIMTYMKSELDAKQ